MIRNNSKKVTGAGAILTCDPSFTGWGWAVIGFNDEIIESGCIKTVPEAKKKRIRVGDDRVRRTSEITQSLLKTIRTYSIRYIVAELPHGSQNAKAAVMIGIVIGILQTLADTLKIGIEWYSEQDAKKALLGKKSAGKDDTIKAVVKQYDYKKTGTKYIDEAVCDAIQVYHVAKQQSPVIRYFNT